MVCHKLSRGRFFIEGRGIDRVSQARTSQAEEPKISHINRLFSEYHPSIVLIESVLQLPNPSFSSKLYRESGRCFLVSVIPQCKSLRHLKM